MEDFELKKVVLPLASDEMVHFFTDKNKFVEVDFDESLKNMTERAMLLYVSNLGMKCAFNKVTHALISEFMTLKNFVDAPMLSAIQANILYYAKYQQIPYTIALDDFGCDKIHDFIFDNPELIIEQLLFLDSFLLYIETRKEDSECEKYNPDDELHDELGFSLLKLLSFEDFMIIYSTEIPPLEEQTYYTKYFDEYMFQGKNLFYYAHTSPLFGMVKAIEDGTIT